MAKELIKTHIRGELALEISNILLQRIESGSYPPGKKIDSIRKIAASLGVSTVSVQNAFKILKEKGVVQSKQGSGMIIHPAYSKDRHKSRYSPAGRLGHQFRDPSGIAPGCGIIRGKDQFYPC